MPASILVSLFAMIFVLFSAPSAAAEFKPEFHGSILFELEDDWTYESDDETTEVNTLYTTIEPYLTLTLMEGLALEASLIYEPVKATDPGDDTAFAEEGLYAEELKLTYSYENFGFVIGKFNPSFGAAWDLAPGVYGVDFAEDYELTERVGLGASYVLATENAGEHTIAANTFYTDVSSLSDSLFTKRGQTHESDGGISNTEDLSSYSVTLDSTSFKGAAEGLSTHLGYRNQSDGDADVDLTREKGYAIGADYTLAADENTELALVAEWVGIDNLGGTADDVNYYTVGLSLTLNENWNIAFSTTRRSTQVDGAADTNDHMLQLSAGYAFDNGISLDVGYRGSEEADVDAHILGGLLSYTYEF